MCLGLFLSTVETSITATALVSIGHYFDNSVTVCMVSRTSTLNVQILTFDTQTTWVVLSYLLSYMGKSSAYEEVTT
jgi:hypothetical protein